MKKRLWIDRVSWIEGKKRKSRLSGFLSKILSLIISFGIEFVINSLRRGNKKFYEANKCGQADASCAEEKALEKIIQLSFYLSLHYKSFLRISRSFGLIAHRNSSRVSVTLSMTSLLLCISIDRRLMAFVTIQFMILNANINEQSIMYLGDASHCLHINSSCNYLRNCYSIESTFDFFCADLTMQVLNRNGKQGSWISVTVVEIFMMNTMDSRYPLEQQ